MAAQPSVKLKLSIMMFLQYAVWGSWAVSMGGYMGSTLKFTGLQIGSIYSTTAIAAMISPLFMGYVADRLFATERIIGVLHLLGAALLGTAAFTKDFGMLYPVMILYALCYMPTLALTNSVSFANIGNPEQEFPHIRIWGTAGWIVAGLIVGFVLDGTTHWPVVMAGVLSASLGIFSFFLPHTPPKGRSADGEAAGGQGIGDLMKNPMFVVFVVCSFLICIPLSFYYAFANMFLVEIGMPVSTAVQSLGQFSELFFMAAMPFFIPRLGVKKMLLVGMAAWVIRYLAFASLNIPLVVVGVLLHGVCYDFFFVASQIYVDTRVSTEYRARAQSFVAFVTLGLGMFIGAYVGGKTVDHFGPVTVAAKKIGATGDDAKPIEVPLPAQIGPRPNDVFTYGKDTFSVASNEGGERQKVAPAIAGPREWTEPKTGDKFSVTGDAFMAAVKQVDSNGDVRVTATEWEHAGRHNWTRIWMWPAAAALITCILFTVGFRDDSRSSAVTQSDV